jgi:hypothetical protein
MNGRIRRGSDPGRRDYRTSTLDDRVDEVTRRAVRETVEDIRRKAEQRFGEHCPA